MYFQGIKYILFKDFGILYLDKSLHKEMPTYFGGNMIDEVTKYYSTFSNDQNRFEAGTLNVAGIYTLSYALDFISEIGMDNISKYIYDLTQYTIEKLKEIQGIKIYGNEYSSRMCFF